MTEGRMPVRRGMSPVSIRNEIESFVEGIYAMRPGALSRKQIVVLAQEALIPAVMVDLFRHVPEGEYDREGLVDALNALIRERQLEDVTGGLVRMPEAK